VSQRPQHWRSTMGPRTAIALAVLLSLAVFITDTFTPLGFAHGMLYAPVVLVAMASGRPRAVLWVAAVDFVLIGAGWLLSPPAPPGYPVIYVVINRVLSFAVLVMVTGVALLTLRYARGLQRAQAEAQEQGRMLRIAGELGQLGAWSYDVPSQRVHWSPEVARLHGRPAGHSPSPEEGLSYYVPSDRPRIQALFEACVGQGMPFDGEFRIVDSAGLTRWVRVVARPVRDDRGAVVRVQGAFQDIGGHKAVERQLDESLASWRRLAEAMPMMVWTTDPQGGLTYASPLMGEYSGLPLHAMQGDGWVALLHPADRERTVAIWQRAVAGGDRYEIEYRMRRHDGAFRWHLARAQAVQLQPDAPPVWYGTAIDIHDRLVLEHEARELAARYETVLESMTDAVIAFDERWHITVVNAQAEKLLQRPRTELLGRNVWTEFPEARGSRFQQEYERCVRDQVVVRFEEPFAPLGMLFEVTAYPAQGGGVTVYFRDVTEPRRVAEQLRQAQRLESIGQLTGGVAHDFNNLLTVVMGNAELLDNLLPEGSTESELASTIYEAATRGAAMTQRLLAFARKQALSPQPVDLNRLVSDMDPLLRRALGEHIHVEVVRGAGLWPALVDPGQLENALLNLAINARDAMPGGGRLVIETANARLDAEYAVLHPGVREGSYVMLAVSDTGHGMTPEVQQRLFEPFFTTKPKGQGTGLGLSMVHGFIKQSNGQVAVYSEPGKGTTMRLYLPRIDSPATERGDRQQGEVPLGHGECVLLVEDDELVRHYAMTLLGGLGYRIVLARDGNEALTQLQSHPEVALLFTDVVMPGGLGGRELADRAQALRPGLPVLFASGYTDNGIVHQGRLDPGVLLLAKPYRRADLARRVRQALDGTQAPPQAAR
jgi:PAS domain S-box-containing protein